MSDTQTPYLGLIKPLVNDPEGEDLWGEKLNRNFDILDTFAEGQGELHEAPQDGPIYGRGTPETWYEVPGRTEFDNAVAAGEENTAAIATFEAPTDGQVYSRRGSTASWVVTTAAAVVSDTPPTGFPISTIWFNSLSGGLFIDYQDPNSRQWVMVNAPGMPEAGMDGGTYGRRNGAWVAMTTAMANYLPLTGGTVSGEIKSTLQTNYRIVQGNYGSFWLQNGVDCYLMLTNSGDPYGTWNALRPFYVHLANGAVSIGTSLNVATRPTWAGLTPWDNGNLNPALYLPTAGGTITGGLNVNGAIRANAAGATGVIYLGSGDHYLYWDGANYSMGGAGTVYHTGNFNPAAYAPLGGVGGNWIVGSSTHSTDGNIYMPWAGDWLSNVLNAKFPAAGGTMPGSLTVSGAFTVAGSAHVNGILYSEGSRDSTTASAANVWQNSTNGNYARVTSSLDYKTALEPLWDSVGDLVHQMKPIFFRSTGNTVDNTEWSWYGFGAEDLQALDPRFALVSEAGKAEGIHTNALIAALVNVVQRMEARIAALEAARV
jgi:hypothetical protein